MNKGLLFLCLFMCNGSLRSSENHFEFEDVIMYCRASLDASERAQVRENISEGNPGEDRYEYDNRNVDTLRSSLRKNIKIIDIQPTSESPLFKNPSEQVGQQEESHPADSTPSGSSTSHTQDSAHTPVADAEQTVTSPSKSTQRKIHDQAAQYALSSACRLSVYQLVSKTDVGQRHPELAQVITAVAVDVALAASRDELSAEKAGKIAAREVAIRVVSCATQRLMPQMPSWVQKGYAKLGALKPRCAGLWFCLDVVPRVVIDTCIDAALP